MNLFPTNIVLVVPIDMRQAILNSIHSGHRRHDRDAMLGAVDEI